MACDRYDEYIGDGSDRHLDRLKTDVLRDITEILGIEPSFGIPDDEISKRKHDHLNRNGPHYVVKSPNRVIPRFFEGSARLLEIEDLTWRYHRNRHLPWGGTTRGKYIYQVGVIFLHKPLYCRKTIIHEVLHGTSVFSRIKNYPQFGSQQFLREGITDTLTGYIMNQKYPDCYEAWRNDTYPQCSIGGFRQRVRLWNSLCRYVGVRTVSDFCLADSDNIAEPWDVLQVAVKEMGFDGFSYPLDSMTRFNENMFREMAFKSIPGLKDTFNDHWKTIDYSSR